MNSAGKDNDIGGSNDTIYEAINSSGILSGNSDDVIGATGDKLDLNGTGDVFSGSDCTIYLVTNESVTITGSNDTIVGGATQDSVRVTGIDDAVYADSSTVDFVGTDTGDVVHGSHDTGYGWTGYGYSAGAYGGYAGGGYYSGGGYVAPLSRPALARGQVSRSAGMARRGGQDIAALDLGSVAAAGSSGLLSTRPGPESALLAAAGWDRAVLTREGRMSGSSPREASIAAELVSRPEEPSLFGLSAAAWREFTPKTTYAGGASDMRQSRLERSVDQLIQAMAAFSGSPFASTLSQDAMGYPEGVPRLAAPWSVHQPLGAVHAPN
jgi:hypothetical protein